MPVVIKLKKKKPNWWGYRKTLTFVVFGNSTYGIYRKLESIIKENPQYTK